MFTLLLACRVGLPARMWGRAFFFREWWSGGPSGLVRSGRLFLQSGGSAEGQFGVFVLEEKPGGGRGFVGVSPETGFGRWNSSRVGVPSGRVRRGDGDNFRLESGNLDV